jgi:hypothetical protein
MALDAFYLNAFAIDGGIDAIPINATGYSALVAAAAFDDSDNGWDFGAAFDPTGVNQAFSQINPLQRQNTGNGVRALRLLNPAQKEGDVLFQLTAGTGSLTQGVLYVLGVVDCDTTTFNRTASGANAPSPFTSMSASPLSALGDLVISIAALNVAGQTLSFPGGTILDQRDGYLPGMRAGIAKKVGVADSTSTDWSWSTGVNGSVLSFAIIPAAGGGPGGKPAYAYAQQ